MRPLLARLAAGLLAGAVGSHALAAGPPRIGLVLGGGGARGAAHIGVLEVLEQLRVPVHCVAGTSMGALVAGAWAAGSSPARMRKELDAANWSDLFLDITAYRDLNLRNKQLVQRFLPGIELGLTPRGLTAPPGVVAGQKIQLFFDQLSRSELGEPDLAQLALPVALIATDIGTGERVVFRDGPLTQAMRASMSVPGLLAPAEVRGRRLVDGGLVDNLPVAEVRDLCNPDVVVAVNVGSPLLKPDEIGSLLSVTAQMVNILTEQNVTRSIAQLGPDDIYIRPDLDGIGATDFDRHAEAAARGRAAAQAMAAQLSRLALPPAAYAAWHRRFDEGARVPPKVDAIEISPLLRVDPLIVSQHLHQEVGKPLNTVQLSRDLVNVYGEGDFEKIDYRLVREGGRDVLHIEAREKPWGPEYLRLGLSLSSTLRQGSSYALRVAWHRTWINRAGGELMAVGELGNPNGLGVEWFQPLAPASRWFFDATAGYRGQRLDLYADEDRISEYVIERTRAAASLGLSFGALGRVRLGMHAASWRPSLRTGLPLLESGTVRKHGLTFDLDLDHLDRRFFPTDGWALKLHAVDNRGGGRPDYTRASFELRHAWSQGPWVFGSRLSWTGSPRGRLPNHDSATLGGFLNLSAYSIDQVAGDSARYGHVRTERVIGRMPLGMRGDMRVGTALELARVGRTYIPTRFTGTLYSLTAYVGGDTPFGPVYVGLAHSFSGATNTYLFIGAP